MKMVRKCCVGDCASNYDAALRSGIAATSTFKFPEDPALHDLWVKAIGRTDWVPSKRSSVCIHHFKPDDIVKYEKPAKLKPDAVPCLFGASILQGRTAVPQKRGRPPNVKASGANAKKLSKLEKTKTECTNVGTVSSADHVIEDCILDFEHFKAYVREKLQHSQWLILEKPDVVHLLSLDDEDERGPIRIDNSIKVYSDLKIKLFVRQEEQTEEQLRWILGIDNKLLRWSQLVTIVDKYGDASRHAKTHDGGAQAKDPKYTEQTLAPDRFESFVEEYLDDVEVQKEAFDVNANDNLNNATDTIITFEIEEQLETNFIEICNDDSVRAEKSFEESDIKTTTDNTDDHGEPLISLSKPILSHVRELQRVKYKCFVCNTDQRTQEEYERHMPTHLSMVPYDCTLCTKQKVTIKTLASLNKHLLMHRKPLKCRFCDVRFTTYASRVLHEDSKHRSNTTFPCDRCHKQFSSLRSYQGHRKIHDDPDAFKCKVCERILSSTYELKLHLRTHTGEKPNKCTFCTVSFNRRSNLTEHIRQFHSLERPFHCSVCGARFRTNLTFKKHLLSHDPGTARKEVKTKRVSRSSKVLQCGDCDRKFVSHASFHAHRRQHDKRYQCSYCGIRIAQLRDFEDHENIHTGARPYECKTCGKTFRTASTYYGHVLVHVGEKKHFCTICNKGFLRFNHVQVHMRSHTGEKPFCCDVCGRKYADKSAYKRHQLTHRPTVADMMRAKEISRSIASSVQDRNLLLLEGPEVNETLNSTAGEQIVQQMDMVFSAPQLLPAEDEGMGVLPSIMSNVLDGQCPIIFEYLSGDSYMTDVPQIITAEDATAISAD